MPNPIVLLHGYSDAGESYKVWKDALQASGIDVKTINVANYITLNNEVTIDDIADGFEYALEQIGIKGDQPFDAMVHSTGMLVMRSWLTAQNASSSRLGRLKHLIALAPATFGSPIAAKGRSLLGRIFKGTWKFGPDFLNSGNLVLYGLELASTYTWDLAHRDLLGKTIYGPDKDTPYVFVFDGTSDYGKLAEIFDGSDQQGTDGTVRWAGCALNTRKIILDLSAPGGTNVSWSEWCNINCPLIPVDGLNHGQILREPPPELIALVLQALKVDSKQACDALYQQCWQSPPIAKGMQNLKGKRWQQFMVHARDSRGNPVTDFSIEVVAKATNDPNEQGTTIAAFEDDVRPYSQDHSYRCFHVSLDKVEAAFSNFLVVRIVASTGTDLVGYQGFPLNAPANAPAIVGPVEIDVTDYDGKQANGKPSLFYPFTTTLIEIVLNREPVPQDAKGTIGIFNWL